MTVDQAFILTHGDLDGMVSAILLLQRLPDTTTIKITNGEKLPDELEKLAASDRGPSAIYMADLPLVAAVAGRVRAAIASITGASRAVHVYDHHLGWQSADGEAVRRLCKTFIVSTKKTTAAAIVWACFLEADLASQRWLKLLAEKDRSTQDDIRRDFGILAALTQRQHWKLQDTALRELASGGIVSEQTRRLADWYYDVHRPREKEIAGRAEVFAARSGQKIAWLDLRAENGHVMVARDAIQQHGVALMATVIAKGVMLGGPSIDQGTDLTVLHGQHEMDGVRITVAGHKSPVRISPTNGTVDDRFVAAARALIVDRL